MTEVEAKPWEFKEEVEIMEEEDSGGALQTRERKKRLDHDHGHGNEEELRAKEEHGSVYFDSTKVSDHGTEPSGDIRATEVAGFDAQKEEENGTSSPRRIVLETHENVNAQVTDHSSYNGNLENGSHSNGSHEVSNSSEGTPTANGKAGLKLIVAIDENGSSLADSNGTLDISNGSMSTTDLHEIEVEKEEHVTKGNVNIEEYDLEKILDEQETHDLYCPNCNSCITRRVILKKRKRTVRQVIRDEPPKKHQSAEHSVDTSSQTVPERQEQESPDIFRCLSCFSFFSPTGCGFNIFRIFGRSEGNQEVQLQDSSPSGELPRSENCGSWLLSCFQSGDSPMTPDADPARTLLLSDTQNSSYAATPGADSTSSVHIHSTTVAQEQLNKPLPAAKNGEEVKPSFGGFHGSEVSSVASHTSAAASQITSGTSNTGFVQAWITHVVIEKQGVVHKGQTFVPKPAADAVVDVQGTTTETSENGSVLSQLISPSDINKTPREPTVVSDGTTPMGEKPRPVIHQAVVPAASPHLVVPICDAVTTETPPAPASGQRDEWDILKAIVYGGLVESVTSLSIVSAAAASGAKTLDIFIMGVVILIGGIPLIFHNIADLRNLGDVDEANEQAGHYWLQLGRRSKFRLHMVMAMLSYILFGLLPPVIYGLSFRESDNRENKMMAVAAASLTCIALLAIGKAHVKRPRTYLKTLMYYLTIGVSASGLSYVAGVLITKLLAHFGLVDQGTSAPPAGLLFPDAVGAGTSAWASY